MTQASQNNPEKNFNLTKTADMPVTLTYTSKGPEIQGYSGLFLNTRLMWHELMGSKELIWRLFIRDFSSKYRQSALGVVWALLMPLVTVGMFVGINKAGVLKIEGVNMPYTLYAIIGLSIWNLYSVGLTACTNAIVSAGSMVVKINFPKVALIIAASLQGVVEFVIRVVLIAAAFIWFGLAPNPIGLFLGLLALFPIYFLMLGMGFVLSLVAGVLRDVTNVLNMGLMAVMLLTPVVYPISGSSMLARANVWNPFNYLINLPRDLIVQGKSQLLTGFWWSAVLSMICFLVGWKLFYLAQTKIAERV